MDILVWIIFGALAGWIASIIMKKNKKFQKEQLMAQGYENFKEFYKNPLK